MSFTSQNLLDMAEALATGVDAVSTIDWVLPSPIRFIKKADFFAAVDDAKDTKAEIELGLVRAAQIRYLNFELLGDEESNREIDGPFVAINWECTIFHESKPERLDQDDTPDDFEKRIRKTNQEHITAIFGIVGEFQGVNPIPALSAFAEAETITPIQTEETQLDVECEFITGVFGDQSKLQLQVRVQLPLLKNMKEAKEVIKESGPKPNIAFVGDRPLREINSQGVTIILPEDQSKPFYHAEAGFIIRQFPDIYKPVLDKGA